MMRARFAFAAALLSLAIPSFASITGVVMDRDGKPIAGARVSSFALETRDARRTRLASKTPDRVPLTTTSTNASGAFTLESPKDAVVDLQADAKGYAIESKRVVRDDESVPLVLPVASLKQGTITAGGKPVAGAAVLWIGGSAETVAMTDAQGKYSVPDPAKWANVVVVLHPDYAVLEDFYFGQKKPQTSLTLDAGIAISGKVVGIDNNTPAAGATLSVGNWPLAKSAPDGTFTIAHAPKKWAIVEAKSGDLFAVRANNPKAPSTMRLGTTGSLVGLVRDAKTQAPLAGVDVRLSRAGNGNFRFGPDPNALSTITDAKGAFSLANIHPGTYEIYGNRPAYSVMPVTITIANAQKAQKTIAANPQARISGTVVDEDKRAVAGAKVTVTSPSQMFGGFPGMENGSSELVTGPDGRFAIYTAREGDAVVDAQKKGFPNAKSNVFKVAAGERKSGVTIVIPRGVALTGRVTDKDGKPLSGVAVAANPADTSGPGGGMRRVMLNLANVLNNDDDNVQTGSDGTFTMRVKEGMYDVAFRREGYAPASVRSTTVNASSKPLDVKLEPGVEITGIVTRGGTPIDGVNIVAMGNDARAMSTTGPDGRFTVPDLAPGSYMLIVNKQEDFVQQNKNVTAPARDLAIELPPGGRVTGRVVDKSSHQPITSFSAGVSMSRSGGGMMMMMPPMMKSFTTDDGSFVLENVPTGTMQIVANAPGYTTGRVPSVVIEEGKTTADIEVGLDTGVKLSGRVTGPDGTPLSGVSVRPDDGRNPMRAFMNEASTTTDANGEYTLDSLEPGEKTFAFSRSGYLTESKTTPLDSKETRLDVQLSSGIRISGLVVTEAGAPVADAQVRASSAAAGGFGRTTRSDGSGAFMFEGMAPGHYSFNATKEGFAEAISRDLDVNESTPVRLTLKTGGTVSGHVTGVAASDLGNVNVTIRSSTGGSTSVPVDQSGNFRADGAPTGTLRVSADLTKGFGERRTTDVKNIELAPGGSAQIDLEFNSATVIRGRVTQNGKPLSSATVMFNPRNSATASTTGRTTTDDGGNYTVTGLADASYSVSIVEQRLNPFTTTYDVKGSATFDIDIKSSSLRGRVLDGGSGDPIVEATVQLRPKAGDMPAFMMQRTATTDANGVFVMDNVASGSYTATADKEGYGSGKNEVYVGDSAPPDIELRLSKNDGIAIKVVDARDGRQISAQAVVYDGAGSVVYDSPMFFGGGSAEPIKVPVPPGQYKAVVSAPGYAAQTVQMMSPSKPTVALTAGGTLVIHSSSAAVQRGRLVSSNGAVYTRPFDRDGIFGIAGATTQITNIQPGIYKLELLGANNSVTKTVDVTITDGGTFSVDV